MYYYVFLDLRGRKKKKNDNKFKGTQVSGWNCCRHLTIKQTLRQVSWFSRLWLQLISLTMTWKITHGKWSFTSYFSTDFFENILACISWLHFDCVFFFKWGQSLFFWNRTVPLSLTHTTFPFLTDPPTPTTVTVEFSRTLIISVGTEHLALMTTMSTASSSMGMKCCMFRPCAFKKKKNKPLILFVFGIFVLFKVLFFTLQCFLSLKESLLRLCGSAIWLKHRISVFL